MRQGCRRHRGLGFRVQVLGDKQTVLAVRVEVLVTRRKREVISTR